MLYYYVAADQKGKMVAADMEADNLNQVLQYLASQNLRPVSIKPVKVERLSSRRLFGGITITDKIFLTKFLALMLKAGTDLLAAINILIADFEKPAMKSFLLEVRENLTRGQPLYVVFERYPRYFSSVFINLVKAGEASGNLIRTFEDLSVNQEREATLRNQVRSAFIYPIILVILAAAITSFLVIFALPKIANVFMETGVEMPFFSKIVFTVGLFVGRHLATGGPIVIAMLIGAWFFFAKTIVGRRLLAHFLSRLPMIKNIYRDLAIQRFASTMSQLLTAGLPIVQTFNVTAEAVGSEQFRASLLRISNEGLTKGLTIGEAFNREPIFPRVVTNLIAISEKAGHLEEVLKTLADFYANNISSSIKTLVSLLEPILLMIMGVLVGTIAVSIIVPIYQLTARI